MSLQQRIETAYARWKQDETKLEKKCGSIPGATNNSKELLKNVTKLKNDLCEFAKEFDKDLAAVNPNTEIGDLAGGMCKKIKDDFLIKIGKISEDDDFIFFSCPGVVTKEMVKKIVFKGDFLSNVKKFQSKYKELVPDFSKSENLINFFEQKIPIFNTQSSKYCGFNTQENAVTYLFCTVLDTFICKIFKAVVDELNLKEKTLLAEDENIFLDSNLLKQKMEEQDSIKEQLKTLESNLAGNDDLKRMLPDLWDAIFECIQDEMDKQNTGITIVQPVEGDVKVFPTKDSPLPSEVKQAGIGDCYLMAALIALVKNPVNRKAIEKCFVQGRDRVEKEKNIEICFFHLVGDSQVSTVKIVVNKENIIMPKGIKNGALWPKLIEKAYAAYRQKGYELLSEGPFKYGSKNDVDTSFIRKNLSGGNSSYVMFAITGKRPAIGHRDSKEKFKAQEIINTVERKLKKDKALTCGFKSDFKIRDAKTHEEIKIYANHEYAIIGIDKTKKYVRIINPWKSGGRTHSANINRNRMEPVQEGGHIAMSFADFEEHFDSIKYTSKKMSDQLSKLVSWVDKQTLGFELPDDI